MRGHVRFGHQSPSLAVCMVLLLTAFGCSDGGSDGGGGAGEGSGGENGASNDGDSSGGSQNGGGNGPSENGGTTGGSGTTGGATGSTVPVDPIKCGNLKQDPGEACDDGNKIAGDGCTELCALEPGFNCPAFGVACDPCGDGIVQEQSEECDDNNTLSGDGCSSSCKLEGNGFQCLEGQPCEQCGNGIREPNERCDDKNRVSGDGCADDCRLIEPDFACPMEGVPCERCGNGMVGLGEACDDNNTKSDDGCTFNCKNEEAGYVCPASGGACTRCGDKLVAAGLEQCDDGNIRAGDGCDARCQKEAGSFCLGGGQLCFVCGNGFIEPVSVDTNMTATPDDDTYTFEQCDDGNKLDGDGCSAGCMQDPAYDCPVPGFGCNICGDGKKSGLEACDDNQTTPTSGDGCAADCLTIEPFFNCPVVGEPCERCGDGRLDPNEQCDDGGRCSGGSKSGLACDDAADCAGAPCAPYGGDGCSRSCDVEAGWVCAQNNDLTHKGCALCGNGKRELLEKCDDDNNVSNDGCSSDCTLVEPGYNCFFDGFACAQCGDGTVDPGEKCDEGAGNKTAGCDNCQIVSPWVCIEAGKPCERCGDGLLGANYETCDDKNLDNGDGCSATCDVEPGWVCTGLSCVAATCGDGFRAGSEDCDDGNDLSGDGCSTACDVERGYVCGATGCRKTVCGDTVVEGQEACDDGKKCDNGTPCTLDAQCTGIGTGKCLARAADGCSDTCTLEVGFNCPDPGQPCTATVCGDGFVEGLEQCDKLGTCGDGANTPCRVAADCAGLSGACTLTMPSGCSSSCTLVPGNACDPGESVCHGGANEGDPCTSELSCGTGDCSEIAGLCRATDCEDGKVEGTEECDDGGAPGVCRGGTNDGGTCTSANDCGGGGACLDGCSSACTINPFYKCENEDGRPSVCRPILELVAVRRFTVANVSPASLVFDPKRRSFIGYKAVSSQQPIELCLDGTLIRDSVRLVCVGGTADPQLSKLGDGEACATGTDCASGVCGEIVMGTCTGGANAGATCSVAADCASAVCTSGYKPGPLPISKYGDGAYDPFTGHTLFLDDSGTLTDLPQCDRYDAACPSTGVPSGSAALQFQATLTGGAALKGVTVGTDGDLYVTYTPSNGSPQVRVHKRRYNPDGTILIPSCPASPAGGTNCTSFETTADRSIDVTVGGSESLSAIFTVPGEQMVGFFNEASPSYTGLDADLNVTVSSSEYFTFLNANLSTYGTSALPGLLFDLGGIGTSYTKYGQSAETAARGGAFVICPNTPSEPCQLFARTCDTDADCASVFPGTRCNLSAAVPYCSAPGDAVDDRAVVDAGKQDTVVNVLLNDSFSESACADPHKRVVSLAVGTTTSTTSITTTRGGSATITNSGANITYDAPSDATKCGFIDTFQYTADLGGGVKDTATVRVVVACDCGDAIKQGSEQCDLGDTVNGKPGARCSATCTINVVCGDDLIDPGEECDDNNTISGDGCSALCTLESVCGDGVTEGAEGCDPLDPDAPLGCRSNCTVPDCGDGVVDPVADSPEQCDDGISNGVYPAPCSVACTINSSCGDAVIQGLEECDDGSMNGKVGSVCSAGCELIGECGNRVRESSEECDASALLSGQCEGNPCNVDTCICENYCGDGRVGGLEECDDDNLNGADACRGAEQAQPERKCTLVRCGDGILDTQVFTDHPAEQCDDGNNLPGDGCTNDCKVLVICGDGTVTAPEQCDDGANFSGDGCSSACKLEQVNCGDAQVQPGEECDLGTDLNGPPPATCSDTCRKFDLSCGNGTLDQGEQCDDANRENNDGCDLDCRFEGCGDGVIVPGEQCDDGNRSGGDGCSAVCTVEIQ